MTRGVTSGLEQQPVHAVLVNRERDEGRCQQTDGTKLGAWLWLGGRVAYLPLYALGVPVVRSLAWIVSLVGIVMVLMPALRALF